jgi:hypothetical protein
MTIRPVVAFTLAGLALLSAPWHPVLAAAPGAAPELSLAQILERNAAARGGLDAWRKVQTMMWTGHVERSGGGSQLPFMYQQKRPNLTHFEIVADRQRSVRVFDGRQGWKARSDGNGPPALQPYGDDEVRAARDALVIDGPVLDARSKGVEVALDGLEEVEGRPAYRLSARLPSGTTQRVWIDAQSFLELKWDRPVRDAAGRPTTVAVYLRDYQIFEGLQMPFMIETGAPGGGPGGDRLVIERITVNPNLPDGLFSRPDQGTPRRGVTVDTRTSPAPR